MHCKSCELLIEGEMKKIPGVSKVDVNHKTGQARVEYSGTAPKKEALAKAVEAAGYTIGQSGPLPWISSDYKDYKYLVCGTAVLWVLYRLVKMLGILDYSVNSGANAGVGIALVVGLVAGVSTCMALVGGLVLGFAARHAELHPEATKMQKFRPHLFFNAGRIAGYTVLGGVIGYLGSALKPSATFLGLFTVVVGVVMMFLGLKLIEIFPRLKNSSLTLPKSLAKLFGIEKNSKEYSHRGVFYAGAASFFLPCGFTQAMQLYAVSTGSFWTGAAVMGLFAVGTSVGLLSLGGLSSAFKGAKARVFFAAAGVAVIILGWYNIANGQALLIGGFRGAGNTTETINNNGVQEIRMTQSAFGYSPKLLTVKKGVKVRWIINSTSQFSCASSIVVPSLGISKSLEVGENIIEFTPTETGEVPFSCSMGMYRGKFVVIDSDSADANSGSNPSDGYRVVGSITDSTNIRGAGGCGAGGGGCGGCGGGNRAPVAPQPGTVQNINSDSGTNVQVIKTVYTYERDIQPNSFTVKAGVPVRFEVDAKENGEGCMSTIMIPRLYNQPTYLAAGDKIIMEFTPQTPGRYPITCAMGVPRGEIIVE